MTLVSALEDFVGNTLAAVPGTLGKLEYCFQHRDQAGNYYHWGLCNVYGETAARQAMEQAHQQIFLETLRTPMALLLEDATRTGADLSRLEDLRARFEQLMPSDLSGGSAQHFRAVLDALEALARAARVGRHPVA